MIEVTCKLWVIEVIELSWTFFRLYHDWAVKSELHAWPIKFDKLEILNRTCLILTKSCLLITCDNQLALKTGILCYNEHFISLCYTVSCWTCFSMSLCVKGTVHSYSLTWLKVFWLNFCLTSILGLSWLSHEFWAPSSA